MFRCKVIDFLIKTFPLKVWQDFLIRHHIQKCPACQTQLASVEEAKPFLRQEDEVGSTDRLGFAIKARLREKRGEKRIVHLPRPRMRWAWTAGIAALITVAVLGVWLYTVLTPAKVPGDEDLVERFQINYIRVENKPARAYVYWPQGTEMVIVWAEKTI